MQLNFHCVHFQVCYVEDFLAISNIPVTIPHSETGVEVNAEVRHYRMCG